MPIFLQYNNLEVNIDEEEAWKNVKGLDMMLSNNPDVEIEIDDAPTPSFALKHVVNKFSAIKNGFDHGYQSIEFHDVINQNLHTIIEKETEEECTERHLSSGISEDSYNVRLEERYSNIYSSNMNSLKFRGNKEHKNPFNIPKSSIMENIAEEDDVPDEDGVSNYNSLYVPKLMTQNKHLEMSAPRGGSECYCCYIRG